MHVLLVTIGSAGDVNPMIGLGVSLKERGHEVTLVTGPYFEGTISRAGLQFHPLGTIEDYERSTANPDLWHPYRAFPLIVKSAIVPSLRPVYDFIAEHDPAETVVVASTLCLGARLAQEKLGFATATLHLQPSIFISADAPPRYPGGSIPSWFPRPMRWLANRVLERLFLDPHLAPAINELRKELGLPPVRRIFGNWMHSPQKVLGMFPEWYAPPQRDWPANTELTGFVGYDPGADAPLPPELEEYLDTGDPPIVFTAGSAMRHGEDFFQASVEACQRIGRRALLVTRHPEQLPAELPAGIRHLDYAPFATLLPRTALMVHHGGIGTMAQGLAAGIPHLIMPLAHDQPDNAARIEQLGVGLSLARSAYRPRAVADRLNHLLNSPDVQAACQRLRGQIDFVAARRATCEAIEQLDPQQDARVRMSKTEVRPSHE